MDSDGKVGVFSDFGDHHSMKLASFSDVHFSMKDLMTPTLGNEYSPISPDNYPRSGESDLDHAGTPHL